jgi:hypothetical protein
MTRHCYLSSLKIVKLKQKHVYYDAQFVADFCKYRKYFSGQFIWNVFMLKQFSFDTFTKSFVFIMK